MKIVTLTKRAFALGCALLAIHASAQTYTTKSGVLDVTMSAGSKTSVFSGGVSTSYCTASVNGDSHLYFDPSGAATSAYDPSGSKTTRWTGLPKNVPLKVTWTPLSLYGGSSGSYAWSVSLVSVVDPGPIVTITASPQFAYVGDPIAVTATFKANGEALTGTRIDQSGSAVASGGAASPVTYNFVPTAAGAYSFDAVASTTNIGWQSYASTMVWIFPKGTPKNPPAANITTDATYINLGQTATITADYFPDSFHGEALTTTSIKCSTFPVANAAPGDLAHRTFTFTPTTTGTYTFTAWAGSTTFSNAFCADCKVVVGTVSGLSAWITASPTSGDAPMSTTLTWGSVNASAVSVSGPGGPWGAGTPPYLNTTAPNGSAVLSNLPAGTYTYTITAVLAGSTVTDSATVTVKNNTFTLSTTASGSGAVTPGGTYTAGTPVTLSATPASGMRFTGWTGDTGLSPGDPALTSSSLTVNMTQDRNIVATFATKLTQTITFNPPATIEIATAASVPLSATASSGLPVSYTVISGPATITSGNVLVFSGPGVVVVRASQSGDSTYAAAAPVDQTIRGLLRTLKVSTGSKESVNKGQGSASEQDPNQILTVP